MIVGARGGVLSSYAGARHDRALRIDDRSADLAAGFLRRCGDLQAKKQNGYGNQTELNYTTFDGCMEAIC